MRAALTFSLLSLSAIFFVVDPFGVVPVFIAMTGADSDEKRRAMAARACRIAWVLLVLFAVAGAAIFQVLGVTIAAFKIAGGVLLLITSFDMVRAQPPRTRTSPEEQSEGAAKEDIAVFPLATPLLAGPGAIATAIVLMGRAHRAWEIAVVLASITVTLVVSWLMLVGASRIARVLGQTGLNVLNRVIGLLLSAVAVQFVIDGVREAIR